MGRNPTFATLDERAQRAVLRDGVIECGRLIGWPTRTTITFAERLARRPWKRCTSTQLAAVLGELEAVRRAVEVRRNSSDSAVAADGRDGHAPRP